MTAAPLAELLRHLGDLPAAFRGPAEVRAVAADLIETLCGARPKADLLDALETREATEAAKNTRRLVLAACHLLWHPSFRGEPLPQRPLERLLVQELARLGPVVAADELDRDEERREELVRRTLRALGQRPAGESVAEAEDRLKQVDSIERRQVLRAAAERERRARQVREAMAKKAAEEAAAKVSRE